MEGKAAGKCFKSRMLGPMYEAGKSKRNLPMALRLDDLQLLSPDNAKEFALRYRLHRPLSRMRRYHPWR
jgi:hypothetical protein